MNNLLFHCVRLVLGRNKKIIYIIYILIDMIKSLQLMWCSCVLFVEDACLNLAPYIQFSKLNLLFIYFSIISCFRSTVQRELSRSDVACLNIISSIHVNLWLYGSCLYGIEPIQAKRAERVHYELYELNLSNIFSNKF